ncbi:unnamed protein product [Amoebophrya sp. A25]|nr:unnamed protein product [Amoebophrya sp. A25]|eukprot:GSA25T00018473001.1
MLPRRTSNFYIGALILSFSALHPCTSFAANHSSSNSSNYNSGSNTDGSGAGTGTSGTGSSGNNSNGSSKNNVTNGTNNSNNTSIPCLCPNGVAVVGANCAENNGTSVACSSCNDGYNLNVTSGACDADAASPTTVAPGGDGGNTSAGTGDDSGDGSTADSGTTSDDGATSSNSSSSTTDEAPVLDETAEEEIQSAGAATESFDTWPLVLAAISLVAAFATFGVLHVIDTKLPRGKNQGVLSLPPRKLRISESVARIRRGKKPGSKKNLRARIAPVEEDSDAGDDADGPEDPDDDHDDDSDDE